VADRSPRVPTGPYLNNYLKSSACLLMLAQLEIDDAALPWRSLDVGSVALCCFCQMPAFHLRSFLEG